MSTKQVEILLVEDNEDDIVILQEAFAESKTINLINIVRDGEEAMTYLRRKGEHKDVHLPGLILLDINMPKMNGFEVLKEIKADPALQHLPVIMLTVSDAETDVVKSYANGACSYIKKPVNFEKLREVVKELELYWTLVSRIPEIRR